MRFLVIGSGGFVSSNFTEFCPSDVDLIFAGRNAPLGGSEWLVIDYSVKSITRVLDAVRPDVVVVNAWVGIPDFSVKNQVASLNLISRVGEALKSRCGDGFRVFGMGSCFEYKFPSRGVKTVRISSELETEKIFSTAKQLARNILEQSCVEVGLEFTWVRPFYLFGKNQRVRSLLPALVAKYKRTGTLLELANSNGGCDFVPVSELLSFLRSVVDLACSRVINFGSGHFISNVEVMLLFREVIGSQLEPRSFFCEDTHTGIVCGDSPLNVVKDGYELRRMIKEFFMENL